jgi:hypothetical protein
LVSLFIGSCSMKTVRTIIFILVLSCLIGCEQLQLNNYKNSPLGDWTIPTLRDRTTKTQDSDRSNLAEVTSPQIIQELKQELVKYSPQVKITEPRAEKTFNQTDVTLELAVEDLPIFQDDRLHLGNHLNLIVDNEPFQSIYNLDEPIILKNLTPGTHTVRVFAASPWGESFKNEGAYAQTTFNVLTQTNANLPNNNLPLLTYNSPTGTYGAEPVLLDFYLNYPEQAKNFASSIGDNQPWQVKATINGTSFMIKDWQPYYLTGFQPGENWVQLELMDELGNAIENTFNNTVRVFTYNPQQPENLDNLGKLVTNQIAFNDAQSIVNQSYYMQPEASTKITPETTSEIVDVEEPEVIEESKNKINNTNSDSAPVTTVSPSSEEAKDKSEMVNQANQPLPSEVETDRSKQISPTESPFESPSTETSHKEAAIPQSTVQERALDQVSEPKSATNENTHPPKIIKTTESNKLTEKTTIIKLEPKPTLSKILITESNSVAQSPETLAEITIPTSDSVEIEQPDAKSDMAIAKRTRRVIAESVAEPIAERESHSIAESMAEPIVETTRRVSAIPANQSADDSFDSESTTVKFLWWKKILVGVRQTMEALAKKLPDQV